ncbi:hypothetical protein LLEC1_04467 [Akanthomyces lecanii]|uniref:Agmatine deiminase n=1 Tax=Cordyceps confragosa TaxID=2714763 RepID=A0A179IFZ1_CORDF|nr:hypothetical protein LLEC1_04467 [Akanthomyces lecanii]
MAIKNLISLISGLPRPSHLLALLHASHCQAIVAQHLSHLATCIRPAETARQQSIVLSWPGAGIAYIDDIMGMRAEVNAAISAVADAVARFEPVKLLVDAEQFDDAQRRFPSNGTLQRAHPVEVCVVESGGTDLWMRDIAPTFTRGADGRLRGVDFNFNGWGKMAGCEESARLAKTLLDAMGVPRVASSITTEGGAFEIDGHGTLMASESCIVNANRNPGQTRAQIEAELARTLGVQKFIWVPGAKDLDSTDFHIDAVARFARPGTVLFASPRPECASDSEQDTQWINAHHEARRILAAATDARGHPLEIIDMAEPRLEEVIVEKKAREALLASQTNTSANRPVFSYVNYLLVNGGVVFPQFGDRTADEAALQTARKVFSDREVVTVNVRVLGLVGGGIHCISQEVPLV